MMRRVVVTGLGVISPVGNDINSFWNNLINGVCGIGYITRFDTSDYKVKIAAEVKDFHPEEYMEKNEIKRMDLFAQYAVAASVQAVNMSDIKGNIDPERFGVYFGSGVGGIICFSAEQTKLNESGPSRISPFFVPMMIANMASAHVAMKHNAQGPNLPVVTACATSNDALGEAYRAIKFGYADAIITGGTEAPITPIAVAGFTNCMALTTCNDIKRASIPFDRMRDGFVMGEGAGALVLEEYEHAKARNAAILAEVVGYANACDAYHITAPHPEGKGGKRVLREGLVQAGFDPKKDKLYINAHGTSTPLNDRTETAVIKDVLGETAYITAISSTKSMTGHTLGAAGAIEAIASVKALMHGIIPPTINYQEPDPECDLNYTPNQAQKANINFAASLSLGFGGHNACTVFRRV
ncbi:MAG: beta-ketoacyl-ACP synthase II [Clostridiales bacterium]|nr:beta-ketoacyl-ACP synthase II [Clostridiales bacterium]